LLLLIADGAASKQIVADLAINAKTADRYCEHLMEKLLRVILTDF